MHSDQLRVLHCLQNVAGNPAALAKAERELGLHSLAVTATPSPLGYHADEVLSSGDASLARQFGARVKLLARALKDFEVIHFNFGETIMPGRRPPHVRAAGVRDSVRDMAERVFWLRDLPLLRAAGKVIAVTYQGDDARQGEYLHRFDINAADHVPGNYYSPETDSRKRESIRRFDRYADLIYALNPDLLHVLPKRAAFLPYASVDPREWRPTAPTGSPPVILHAPTHRGVKGTEFILAAVNRLRAEGARFEFVLVEGLQYAEARQLYERADLLVDQVLLGWYGGLAVELMALGKPVACYLRDEDLELIPAQMRAELPVLRVTPSGVYELLRGFLEMPVEDRVRLGERSRRYAESWHDPIRIATTLSRDYHMAAAMRGGSTLAAADQR